MRLRSNIPKSGQILIMEDWREFTDISLSVDLHEQTHYATKNPSHCSWFRCYTCCNICSTMWTRDCHWLRAKLGICDNHHLLWRPGCWRRIHRCKSSCISYKGKKVLYLRIMNIILKHILKLWEYDMTPYLFYTILTIIPCGGAGYACDGGG